MRSQLVGAGWPCFAMGLGIGLKLSIAVLDAKVGVSIPTHDRKGAPLLFSALSINPFHILLSGSKTAANAARIPQIRPLQRPGIRSPLAENLERARHLQGRKCRPAAKILRPGDVPLPVGAHPHGPRPQLHHGRRGRALQARPRHERAAPDGLDAFGLPAGNAAMERKVHPRQWTYANIAAMKKQLMSMGLSLDWSREIATCDPAYYKHQQRMFLDFLAAGLVAREYRKVNWDPVDMTVLANEQVID